MAHIFVGTSGWSYQHWKNNFYPPHLKGKDWLAFYSKKFNTVEINSTFYRLPRKETLKAWKETVGKGFLFAVKLSKLITHTKRLKEVQGPLQTFLDLAQSLQDRLGPLLVQLPPGLRKDIPLLKEFLGQLGQPYQVAIEFRNTTWFDDEVFSLLEGVRAMFCWHDYGKLRVPRIATCDSIYVRLHGPSGRYKGSYPEEILKALAEDIWKTSPKRVYAYFNNDADGHAVQNAITFQGLLKERLAQHIT